MKMDNFIRLNTVLLPSPELSGFAINLVSDIDHDGEYFHLDNQNFLPHISIYYAPEFPEKNLEKINEVLKNLVTNQKPLKLIPREIKDFYGYIGIWFEKTKEINEFHQKVLDFLNPLREGRVAKDYENLSSYPQDEIDYINKYGAHLVLDAFNPHLSLACYKDASKADQITQKIKGAKIPETFSSTLALAPVGPKGTVQTLRYSVEFVRL